MRKRMTRDSTGPYKKRRTIKKYKYKPPRNIQLMGGEKKNIDTSKGQTTVASAGTVLTGTLVAMTQGTGDSQRIGRTIKVMSVQLYGRCILPSTSTVGNTSDRLRLIIFLDRQANKDTPAVTDLLTTADINSFRKLSNGKRFKFLYDEVMEMNSYGGAGNGTSDDFVELQRTITCHKDGLNIPIEYTANAGDKTDLTENNIGIIGISASGNVNVKYICRIRYTDK